MLYDRRWDLPDPVRDGFIAFLRSKPAGQSYPYRIFTHCACAQYCRSTRSWWDWFWRYGKRAEHEREVWQRFDIIAAYRPHTFGALLQRIEAPQQQIANCTGGAYGSDVFAVTCL